MLIDPQIYVTTQTIGINNGASSGGIVGWASLNRNDVRFCSSLEFYASDAGRLTGFNIIWSDNSYTQLGNPGNATKTTLTLQPGEVISSWTCYVTATNGPELAGLVITTNLNQTCTVGQRMGGVATSITTDTIASGLLIGCFLWQNSSNNVCGIEPVFCQSLVSVVMSNMQFYGALNDPTLYCKPVSVAKSTVTNNGTMDQNWDFSDSVTKQTSHEWIHSVANKFGVSVSASAGFLFATVKTTASWSIENTYTTDNKVTDIKTITWGAKGIVPQGKTVSVDISVWQGTINLPYSATITLNFRPDLKLNPLSLNDQGIYRNVEYSDAFITIQ